MCYTYCINHPGSEQSICDQYILELNSSRTGTQLCGVCGDKHPILTWTTSELLQYAGEGNLTLIEKFLECQTLDLNLGDSDGRTPLYMATWKNQPHVVKRLLRNTRVLSNKAKTTDGYTPLMIASFRGNGCGLDSGELEEDVDDSSAAVIQDLIAQGANLNQQMEKTKETPLHLAARHARADAAKTLLDSGADANAQDITGRTPLHAAVASDAQGVFHILIKNRSTNLNARTEDGTTPLILAARLAIEGMVEQLIEAQADINMADGDQEGKIPDKTPLHWAASVNNVDAVNVLLQHGANRDAQDKKDETPLFLAAREGSYQAAKALLDHCANRDIQDHMDRLPIHIAQERMHQDIVTLLEQHIPPAPQHMAASSASLHPHHQQQHSVLSQQLHLSPPSTHSMSILTASGNQHMMAPNATGTKPRAKKQRTKSLAQSPEDNNIQNVNINGGATLPRNGQTPQQRKQQQQPRLET